MKLSEPKYFFNMFRFLYDGGYIYNNLFQWIAQMGPENATEKEWGVNYRALNDLFNISHDRRDTIKYELGVQMVEIYNEQIRDLLGTGGSQKKYPSYSRLVSV